MDQTLVKKVVESSTERLLQEELWSILRERQADDYDVMASILNPCSF